MRGSITFLSLHFCSLPGVQFVPLALSRKFWSQSTFMGWKNETIFPDVRWRFAFLFRSSICHLCYPNFFRSKGGAIRCRGCQETGARATL
jgi:hypothetical protein